MDNNLQIKTVSLNTPKENVQSALKEQRIVSIDLELTPDEKEILSAFNIGIEGSAGNFLYWGNVNNPELLSNLKIYLSTLGENSGRAADLISNLMIRIVRHVGEYFDTEFAWIETKTFLANDTFTTPRWHTDNKFFKPHTAYKLVWAAKGSQTRFGISENNQEFNRLTVLEIQAGHGNAQNIQVRKNIDQIVTEIKMPQDNATLYRSGGEDPVVHSEPNMHQNRLFLAIVPGAKEDVAEWHERKKQKDVRKNVTRRKWYYNSI